MISDQEIRYQGQETQVNKTASGYPPPEAALFRNANYLRSVCQYDLGAIHGDLIGCVGKMQPHADRDVTIKNIRTEIVTNTLDVVVARPGNGLGRYLSSI